MTTKDYELIASAIKSVNKTGRNSDVFKIARRLGVLLLEDNPKFDWIKFQKACGFETKEKDNECDKT